MWGNLKQGSLKYRGSFLFICGCVIIANVQCVWHHTFHGAYRVLQAGFTAMHHSLCGEADVKLLLGEISPPNFEIETKLRLIFAIKVKFDLTMHVPHSSLTKITFRADSLFLKQAVLSHTVLLHLVFCLYLLHTVMEYESFRRETE